uniref:Uncharacterized protein K02A2.6-like n=1 Tax=Saccoglossus kowalevskii TaxID=10224 RepID=A0ABM0MTM2_SACKO
MAYFDPVRQTEVLVDASPVGLGAILTQRDSTGSVAVISLASRSLTPVEQRYSQVEREALAVTWGVLHYHLYLYGHKFEVMSDHMPLVPLFNSSTAKPPARIERWILKLQQYDFKVSYRPGKLNPADYMSRHPLSSVKPTSREEKMAEEHINSIIQHATPKTVQIEDIQAATKTDTPLLLCMQALQTGKWDEVISQSTNTKEENTLKCLYAVKNELTVHSSSDLLLRNSRIVIPEDLQQAIINIAHEGHQGIVKTKQLLREKVWFPGIDNMVKETVESCTPCQLNTVEGGREPLKMSVLPKGPWEEVSVDFSDLPNGGHNLVVTDDYSRYPVVEVISSTASRFVIPKLDSIFALFGIPRIVRSDNGPPFSSIEFAAFAKDLGFKHRKITPRWPRANGEVERFMRTMKKIYRIAHIEGKAWKQQLYRFLRNYRATPHTTTSVPLASLLLKKPMRVRLPEISTPSHADSKLRQCDKEQKTRMKLNADNRENTNKKQIQVGDTVLIKRDGYIRKDTTPYITHPYRVTDTNGSMITAMKGDHKITRSSSRFKVLKGEHDGKTGEAEQDETEESTLLDSTPPSSASQPANVPRRDHPQRQRQPPSYLKDYVQCSKA